MKKQPNKIAIQIKGKNYLVNLKDKSVWEYVFSRGGEENGDIEGWEIVGKILKVSIFLLLLSFPTLSHAWEFSKNPDRFPSLGFNVSSSRMTGSSTYRTIEDKGPIDQESFGADVRLPVGDGVTLNFSYDQISYAAVLERNHYGLSTVDNYHGSRYGLGLRVYFNK